MNQTTITQNLTGHRITTKHPCGHTKSRITQTQNYETTIEETNKQCPCQNTKTPNTNK